MRTDAEFTPRGRSRNLARHRLLFLSPQLVSRAHEYDFDQLVNELNLAVHDFNARGSSFVFNIVKRFIVVITQYRPLSGSSYPHTSLNREKEGNNQRH